MPILQRENDDFVRLGGLYIEDYQDSLGDYLANVAEDTWELNPSVGISRLHDLDRAYLNLDEELVDYQTLNEEYKDLGLKFENDVTRGYAELLAQGKREERTRQAKLARAPSGFVPAAAGLATGLVTSIIDPVGVAATFVPIVGQARFAQLAGRFGTNTARVLTGATEGLVGTALIEPLVLGAASVRQLDYSLEDSFMNVAFGTVIGSGLHFASGKITDAFASRSGTPTLKEYIHDSDGETQVAAIRAAVAQEVQGVRANVDPVFRVDPSFNYKQDLTSSTFLTTNRGQARFVPDLAAGNTVVRGASPDSHSFDPTLFAPVRGKDGKILRYKTEAEAIRASRTVKSEGLTSYQQLDGTSVVTRDADRGLYPKKMDDGSYVLQRRAASKILRKTSGEPRTFNRRQSVEKFISQQLDGDKNFSPVPIKQDGQTKWAILDVEDASDLAAFSDDLNAVTITAPAKVKEISPNVVQGAMKDAADYMVKPENKRAVDPAASEEFAEALKTKPKYLQEISDEDLVSAQEDLDFALDEVQQLASDLELDEDFVSNQLKQYDDAIEQAEALGRGYEAAALCQLRT